MDIKFDRRLFANFSWTLLIIVFLCMFIGIVNVFSTGTNAGGVEQTPLFLKQIQWMAIGMLLMLLMLSINYHTITRYAYAIYIIVIILLIVISLFGYHARGSQRWLSIFGFSMQPSEFMKLAIILALVKFFDDNEKIENYSFRDLWKPALIVAVPFILILKQPDLGTAIVIGLVFISMLLMVGIKKFEFLVISGMSAVIMPFLWFLLKNYQKERVMTFLDPERDPFGSGYHIIQSVIAVGSGKFFGKGFMQGTQTQLKFLPEQQTDFIFSVFAEEWGFLGVAFLIFLLLGLIFTSLNIARRSKDFPGTLLAFGITALIFWETFINIAMVIGILPVVGIPLPFMSYGGSSIVMMFMCVGLLINISMRRFMLHSAIE